MEKGGYDGLDWNFQDGGILLGNIGRGRTGLDPGADFPPRKSHPALLGGGHDFTHWQLALRRIQVQMGNFLPDGLGPLRGNFCHWNGDDLLAGARPG